MIPLPLPLFRLRHDPLRWIIASLLLAPALASAQDGIQPAPGPNGAIAGVDPNGSATVITPVAPNANGDSVNFFELYNVAREGVVINNSLSAGESQLAGYLAANPQYQGRAADMIFNYVIGQEQSRILGTQEIFGQAADYVLANPNGIYVNGGGFINAPRASFLVGRPDIDGTGVVYLDSLRGDGLLEVGPKGLQNPQGSISLIAPRIETTGDLTNQGQLDIIAGNNRLRYDDGEIVETAQRSQAEQRYDASLFGAMRAGRIRIVSTAQGAGVRLASPLIEAGDGVQVHSAGELHLSGDRRDANHIKLTRLDSGAGRLDLRSEGDMHLSALDASGSHINVRTRKNLYLDAATRETIAKDNENWKNKAWFVTTETYHRDRTTTETQQLGSLFAAAADMKVEVGENAIVRGAFVRANGHLEVRTGGDLQIEAAIDRKHVDERSAHRKHLWRQDTRRETIEETAEQSMLLGGDIDLQSGGKLRIGGSSLESRTDMTIKARSVDVDTVALKDSKSDKRYRGDLVSGHFFGDTGKDGDQRVTHQGSTVEAGGKLIIDTDRLAVRGSQVKGSEDALLISKQDGVFIESVENIRKVETSKDNSKVFGLFKDDRRHEREETLNKSSEVRAESNLQVVASQDIVVKGSTLIADGKVTIEAGGDVKIEPVKDRVVEKNTRTTHGYVASAGETKVAEDGKPGSKQFAGQVGWEKNTDSIHTVDERVQGSALEGNSLTLKAGDEVVVDSSRLKTRDGDAEINGKAVKLLSTDAEHSSEQERTVSGGYVRVEGGIDRVGSASVGKYEHERVTKNSTQAAATELDINGTARIIADNGTGLVQKHGARINVKGIYEEHAGTVDNQAVYDTTRETTDKVTLEGKAGLSIEYKDITRPIEKAVNGEEQTRLQQNGVEDAMDPPSLGIDIAAGYQKRKAEESTKTARGTQIKADVIDLHVPGTVTDVATQYEARKIQMIAQEHQMLAAANLQQKTLDRWNVEVAARVDTVTGSDINAKLLGVGDSMNNASTQQVAVPGSLTGRQGITIQLGTNGIYEGTRINGGSGDVSIVSGGTLSAPQANDRQSVDEQSLGGFGQLKASTTPGASKAASLLSKLDGKESHTQDAQARITQIDTTGKVRLKSEDDLRLEGTRIGSAQQPAASIDLQANGRVQVLPSTDTHEAKGSGMGGALQITASGNPTAGGKGGGLGGAFTTARVDEQAQTSHNAEFQGRDGVTFASAAKADDAVHLQGLQATTKALQVDASNGGVLIESAQSTDHRDNIDMAVGAGANSKSNPAAPSADTSGLYGRVKLGLEQLDSTTHSNARLKADSLMINSADDTRLAGANLEAGNITGAVGGDLHVETRQDQVDGLAVNVDLKLSREKNPQGLVNGATSLAGPFGAKVQEAAGKRLSKIDPNITPSVGIDVVEQHRNTALRATALTATRNIDLQVQGNTTLTGASLTASNVELGDGAVKKTDLSGQDYRAEAGINGSNAPLDLVKGLKDSFGKDTENGVNLGLVRGGGHSETQQLKATVQQR
ncbi:hemagglutinin repeat-containing protein [Pseudomonas baltica]|uniref:hemagglutinin repeat-containing protein n=1 Tax=Pseudomonas baltica TaxID=2762576 RepID=UPI0028A0CA44|nr:hemagglutinin repeat-containing protein [Pseudomonas baltica]